MVNLSLHSQYLIPVIHKVLKIARQTRASLHVVLRPNITKPKSLLASSVKYVKLRLSSFHQQLLKTKKYNVHQQNQPPS